MRFLSVCSGIEAASVAWGVLGWSAVAVAEIEPFPCAVLAHHYAHVPNWGDMTRYRDWPDAAVDVLVGGTPCQSFSVAGLRKGLADPRGNLALVYLGILDRYRPSWMVWENVPGVLSSNAGRDFGAFLGGLAELGYGFAYRVLDAQYFGLAQRRKRVFVVGHIGDWRRAAAVLFEPESLSGHPAPRRDAGKDAAGAVTARAGNGSRQAGAGGNHVAFGGNNTSGAIDTAAALNAKVGAGRMDFESETLVLCGADLPLAHSLRGGGFDASEDGTGRGKPLVPVCDGGPTEFLPQSSRVYLPDGVSPSLPATDSRMGNRAPQVLAPVLAGTLDGAGDRGGTTQDAFADRLLPIAFDETQITSATNRCNPQPGDPCHPLARGARPPTLAFHARQDPDSGPVTHPLDTDGSSIGILAPDAAWASEGASKGAWRVRRLTPTECERLQGFPDGYTLIHMPRAVRKAVEADFAAYLARQYEQQGWGTPSAADLARLAADGPRYKALGNSMAVPVMRWIGAGIAAVDAFNPTSEVR